MKGLLRAGYEDNSLRESEAWSPGFSDKQSREVSDCIPSYPGKLGL